MIKSGEGADHAGKSAGLLVSESVTIPVGRVLLGSNWRSRRRPRDWFSLLTEAAAAGIAPAIDLWQQSCVVRAKARSSSIC
jgi:hypothetical protein